MPVRAEFIRRWHPNSRRLFLYHLIQSWKVENLPKQTWVVEHTRSHLVKSLLTFRKSFTDKEKAKLHRRMSLQSRLWSDSFYSKGLIWRVLQEKNMFLLSTSFLCKDLPSVCGSYQEGILFSFVITTGHYSKNVWFTLCIYLHYFSKCRHVSLSFVSVSSQDAFRQCGVQITHV